MWGGVRWQEHTRPGTHIRVSGCLVSDYAVVGQSVSGLPRFHWRTSQVVTGEVACAPPAPLSIVQGRSRACDRGVLLLWGGGPGWPECGRSDGGAACMADDRVLPPLIADETGAAGTAEQGRQGYAREFCHGWFHNIIPAFRPAADGTTTTVPSRIACFSRSNGWKRTRVRAGPACVRS